jgi:hypothetical protein
VEGDSVRLTQVFSNLLNNAAKYTPEGGRIDVFVERDGRGHAVVRVKDSGAGIPQAMLGAIFDMFVQVSGTARAAQGGLGIGLTLVKSLVELHGGTVGARATARTRAASSSSRCRCWTTACARREGRRGAGGHRRGPPHPGGGRQPRRGGIARGAAGPAGRADRRGVQRHRRAGKGRELSPVVRHPGHRHARHGRLRAGARLRAHPQLHGMGLVALTGWGQPDDRLRIARAGFDHHLLKPVDVEELSAVLRKLALRQAG